MIGRHGLISVLHIILKRPKILNSLFSKFIVFYASSKVLLKNFYEYKNIIILTNSTHLYTFCLEIKRKTKKHFGGNASISIILYKIILM